MSGKALADIGPAIRCDLSQIKEPENETGFSGSSLGGLLMLGTAKSEMAAGTKGYAMVRVVICSIMLLPSLAFAQDAARGRELAARWCAGCHVVDRSPVEARADGVPTFPAIAAKDGTSAEQLRAAMNPTHGRMPDLSLGKRDQDDLVAYIFSLRRN